LLEDNSEDDSSYFTWNPSRMVLETVKTIDRPLGKPYNFRLAAFCPYSKQNSWSISIYVSEVPTYILLGTEIYVIYKIIVEFQMNKFAPKFKESKFVFNIPRTAKVGDLVGQVTKNITIFYFYFVECFWTQ